ncbi:MAG: glycosyltransferase family 4 protein [Haloarculaceae archaeon]
MERPSVTVVTEYFAPEEASTAQLMTELTAALTDRFDVSVVTARPNYHPDDRSASVPRRSDRDGVGVTRVRATRFDKDRLPLRALNWLSFTLLATLRLLWAHRDDDAVMALSNPPLLPLGVWLYSRLTGTPYVYLVYDMYPDIAVELGVLPADHPVTRLWARAMERVYCDADRVVVLGESMRRRVERNAGDRPDFDPESVAVVPNWADDEEVTPMAKEDNDFAREHGTVDRFTLVYSGNVGRYHDVETAIDAVGRLEARGRDDVQLLVIGEGARKAELRERVAREGIENVRFLPFQPRERLPETLTCGDASLVGVRADMVGTCVSSKLYSSLAAGMPVLAVVGEGDEVARAVEACDCGEHVLPGDAERAADVIARWADDPDLRARLGENARACFERRYTLDHAVDAYADLFEAVVSEG